MTPVSCTADDDNSCISGNQCRLCWRVIVANIAAEVTIASHAAEVVIANCAAEKMAASHAVDEPVTSRAVEMTVASNAEGAATVKKAALAAITIDRVAAGPADITGTRTVVGLTYQAFHSKAVYSRWRWGDTWQLPGTCTYWNNRECESTLRDDRGWPKYAVSHFDSLEARRSYIWLVDTKCASRESKLTKACLNSAAVWFIGCTPVFFFSESSDIAQT